jgi:hypothetical protein
MRLQFTQASQAGIHRLPIQRDPKMCLNDMLPPARHYDIYANVLFYEVLDVDITEFETKRSIKVTWLGLNNSEEVSIMLTSLLHMEPSINCYAIYFRPRIVCWFYAMALCMILFKHLSQWSNFR